MTTDINVEIVLVSFITKQGIGLLEDISIYKFPKTVDLGLFVCQPPCLQVEVEVIMLHDVLLHPLDPFDRRHSFDLPEPLVLTPLPDFGRENVCKHQGIEKFRKYKDLHVGEREGAGVFFEVFFFHYSFLKNKFYHGEHREGTEHTG